MRHGKKAASASIILAAVFAAPQANALIGFNDTAPKASVAQCVTELRSRVDYRNAGRVMHEVETKARRSSGYKVMIETTVFDENGEKPIREYASVCTVTRDAETKEIKVRERSL